MLRLVCLLLLCFSPGISAPAADPVDNAAELLRTGQIHELSKTFAATVELSVLGDENIYTAAKAGQVLTDFFKNKQVQSVKILHRVESNPNIRFAILILTTTNGTYRTSITYKQVKGQFVLNDLHVEEEK
jgi:hypothetical protein